MTNQIITEVTPSLTGDIGVITLNRGEALNALTRDMCQAILDALTAWQAADTVQAVVIRSHKPNCFCAGGDVRQIYQLGSNQQFDEALDFFKTEYAMNQALHHFNKPYIALLDGITMGGGAGISLHGSHPIVTQNTRFAMPEGKIGFFPDIGASYFLTQCPYQIGPYLALTAEVITAPDILLSHLSEHYVDSKDLPALFDALQSSDLASGHSAVEQVLQNFATTPLTQSKLADHLDVIESCFDKDSVDDIIQALQSCRSDWAMQTAQSIAANSPTSSMTTLSMLQLSETLDFDSIMAQDLRLAKAFLQHHDFYEGVRAQLIDKDKSPIWQRSASVLTH